MPSWAEGASRHGPAVSWVVALVSLDGKKQGTHTQRGR